MTFAAYDAGGNEPLHRTYDWLAGGFVVDDNAVGADRVVLDSTMIKFPFDTGADLLVHCKREQMSMTDLMLANELSWRSAEEVRTGMLEVWSVMETCVDTGCHSEGVLPGGLRVPRRAPDLAKKLKEQDPDLADPLHVIDWVNLYALAVNEENASGGRIVTAPTNGRLASSPGPALLHAVRSGC